MAHAQQSYSPIVDSTTLPNFETFTLPHISGADGKFTKRQRYIVQMIYLPKWDEFLDQLPTQSEQTKWKTIAVQEIMATSPFLPLVQNQVPGVDSVRGDFACILPSA